jgi:(2Fe-2S) ferredoxin
MRPERVIFVCQNVRPSEMRVSCGPTGGDAFLAAMRRELKERGLKGPLRAVGTSCLGLCEGGPHAVVYPDGVWYSGFEAADAAEILDEHLIGGRPVERLLGSDPEGG